MKTSFAQSLPALLENDRIAPIRRGVVVCVLILAAWVVRREGLQGGGADFATFLAAARAAESGTPLYHDATGFTAYAYTPFLALLLRPLAHLRFETACQIWLILNIGAIFAAAAFYLAASGVRRVWMPELFAMIVLVGLFNICARGTLRFGMINAELLLVVTALYFLDHKRLYWPAALLIALAALLKTWALGLVLLLLVRGAYRQAVASVLLFVIGFFLCFSLVGLHQLGDFVRSTRHFSSQPILLAHSIPGFALAHFKAGVHRVDPIDSPLLRWGFVTLGYSAFAWVLLHIWTRRKAAADPERLLHATLIVAILVLSLPVSHVEYILLSFPLIWTLLLTPDFQLKPREKGLVFVLGLWLFLFLLHMGPYYNTIFGPGYKGINGYLVSVPFFAHMTAAAMAYALMLNEIACGKMKRSWHKDRLARQPQIR